MWLDSNSYNIDFRLLLTNAGKFNINQQCNKVTKITNMFSYIGKLANFFGEGTDTQYVRLCIPYNLSQLLNSVIIYQK